MNKAERELLVRLLTDERVAALAILVEGKPFAGLVPFAMTADGMAALIHASQLARHSRGLGAGAPFALLVYQADIEPETNPAQLPRVTLEGSVAQIARDSDEYDAAKQIYLEKFPKSEITFQLGDFTLYRLEVEMIRFVAGFGKAFDVEPAELAGLREP